MKKLFFLMAAAAALFTSCSKDDTIGGLSRGKVTFEVSAPELATRYGEGTTATTLQYAVYDMVENTMVKTEKLDGKFSGGKASLSIDLVEGRTYEVAFWAESPDSPYSFNADAKTISYDPKVTLTANNENYDAFFAYVGDDQNEKFEVGQTVNVTLKRPFAQLNIATNDTQTAKDLDVEVVQTAVKVKAYTSFNLQTGAVEGNKTDVEFGLADQINGTLTSSATTYDWLSMNYILTDGTNTDVTFTFTDAVGSTEEEYTRTYTAVPAKRNYRTNIIGSILTDPTVFELDIEEGFTQPDEEYTVGDVHKASSASDIQKIINEAPNGTPTAIVLEGDIDLSDMSVNTENTSTQLTTRAEEKTYGLLIPAGKELTIDLAGFTISQEKTQTARYGMITNNGTLTIMDSKGNGKISYKDSGNGGNWGSNTVWNYGTLTIESGTIENNSTSDVASNGYPHPIDNSGKLIINGGTFDNNANYSSMRIWCTEDDDTEVTINGGTFYGSIDFHNVNKNANKGTLTINGGEFNPDTYTNSSVRLLGFGTDVDEMNGYINGGVFKGQIKLNNYVGGDFNSQVFFISGGTFHDASVFNFLSDTAEEINITLGADITSDKAVVIAERKNSTITIDGQNHKFNGVFMIYGNSDGNDNATTQFKNINFTTSTAKWSYDNESVDAFIWSANTTSKYRYAEAVTVENCTFTATGDAKNVIVGIKLAQNYNNVTITNCTATDLHTLIQNSPSDGETRIDNVTITGCKNGIGLNKNVAGYIKNSNISTSGYGIRLANNETTTIDIKLENNTISSKQPVVARYITEKVTANIAFEGTNKLTTTGDNIYQVIVTADNDDKELVAPTGSYTLTGAEGFNVYPDSYESASYYAASNDQLSTAITAAISAAAASGDEDVVATVNLADGSYDMPTPELRNKELTIIGSRDAVIDASKVNANNQFVSGAALKFEGVTLNFGTDNYMGFANCASLTYKDCAINGLQFAYNPIVFDNCDFNSNGAEHCVWTYGAKEVTFNDCDFTYADRCVNVYLDNGTDSVKVDFSGCKFTNSDNETEGAVEINSSAFSKGANVNFTNCTAPSVGDMVFISKWDGTSGKTATVTVDGQTYNTPVHQ